MKFIRSGIVCAPNCKENQSYLNSISISNNTDELGINYIYDGGYDCEWITDEDALHLVDNCMSFEHVCVYENITYILHRDDYSEVTSKEFESYFITDFIEVVNKDIQHSDESLPMHELESELGKYADYLWGEEDEDHSNLSDSEKKEVFDCIVDELLGYILLKTYRNIYPVADEKKLNIAIEIEERYLASLNNN